MALIKVTFFFEVNQRGWSESWYTALDTGNLAEAFRRADALGQERQLILGKDARMTFIRTSYVGIKNDAFLAMATQNADRTKNRDTADPDIAILQRSHDPLSQKHKNTFLRGFWDSIEVDGGKFIGRGSAEFAAAHNAYAIALSRSSWGWLGVTQKVSGGLAAVTVNADKTLNFRSDAQIFGPEMFGTRQVVRIGFATGSKTLNQSHVVRVVDATNCTTIYPLAIFGYGGGGRITRNTYDFIQVGNTDVLRISPRKSGAPFFEPVGRRRAKGRG